MRNHLSWMITRKNWIKVPRAEKPSGYNNGGGGDFEVVDTPVEENEALGFGSEEMIDMDSGERLLRNLDRELPENYHVSAKHKVLFGTLKEKKDKSGFPIILRANALFTTFGLEYGDKRLPYRADFQQEIHERNVDSILDIDEDGSDDVYEPLRKKNDIWEDPFSAVVEERIRILKEKEYDDLISALRREGASLPFSGEDEYRKYIKAEMRIKWDKEEKEDARRRLIEKRKKEIEEGKKGLDVETQLRVESNKFVDSEYEKKKVSDLTSLALKEGIMTEQEVEKYNNYQRDRGRIMRRIEKVYRSNYGDKMFYTQPTRFQKKISKYLSAFARDHVMDSGMEPAFQQRVLGRLKLKILEDATQTDCLDQLVNEYRGFDQNAEIGELMKELEALTNERYVDLYPKWLKTMDRFFVQYTSNKLTNREQILEQKAKKKDFMRNALSRELMVAELSKLKKRIADVAFPDIDEKIKDVFVLTTGVVVMMDDGELKKSAISPLDNRMLGVIDNDKEKECWIKIWKQHQGDEDLLARDVLGVKLGKESVMFEDDFDKKVSVLLDANQIQLPEVFDKETGKVHDSVQKDDYELLGDLLPIFGAFVKDIDLGVTDKDLNLTNTRLEIIGYLSGNNYDGHMMLVEKDCRLKLREINKLITGTVPEKIQKVYARISAELGVSLYESLPFKKKETFNGIVGPNVEISEVGFFKLFHKSVSSPLERRRLMRRTIFLKEFNKYLAGKSDERMQRFFDDLKKKPQLT